MPGIIIAGTHSGCGKTTITLGIMAALKKKGLIIQPFKVGPDFIDAGLHRIITGRPSRNLDLWMCGEEYVRECFYRYSLDAQISIVEGVMGLYDGELSTARLAEVLDLPVVLVVDAFGMAESAGAVVKGFTSYMQKYRQAQYHETPLFGIIFNRVSSEKHYGRLKNSVQDVPVIGYLPKDLNFKIPNRHLGLVTAEEDPISKENIERLADTVLDYIDIGSILRLLEGQKPCNLQPKVHKLQSSTFSHRPKIATAYDKAFCFYYEDNLDLLKKEGAEIITFSLISDSNIPDNVHAIYIGGGYPELYAEELSKNRSMINALYNWVKSGRPLYAECGGLMYLSQGIYDLEGNFFKMANIFPFKTKMKKERPYLGYREIELNEDCILGEKGQRIRGHEFHYSEIDPSTFSLQPSAVTTCYSLFDNTGKRLQKEGYRYKNALASYVHVHFGSNPAIAGNFISFIKEL